MKLIAKVMLFSSIFYSKSVVLIDVLLYLGVMLTPTLVRETSGNVCVLQLPAC
jgi:hypothetical protein